MASLADCWRQAGNFAEAARCEERLAAIDAYQAKLSAERTARSQARWMKNAGRRALVAAGREKQAQEARERMQARMDAFYESCRYNCSDCQGYGYTAHPVSENICPKCKGTGKQTEPRY